MIWCGEVVDCRQGGLGAQPPSHIHRIRRWEAGLGPSISPLAQARAHVGLFARVERLLAHRRSENRPPASGLGCWCRCLGDFPKVTELTFMPLLELPGPLEEPRFEP